MAVVYVSSGSTGQTQTATITVSIDLTNATYVTAHAGWGGNTTVSSVVVNGNLSLTAGSSKFSSGTLSNSQVWSGAVNNLGVANVVFTFSAKSGFCCCEVMGFSGVDTRTPISASGGAGGTGTLSSGTLSGGNAGSFIAGGCHDGGEGGSASIGGTATATQRATATIESSFGSCGTSGGDGSGNGNITSGSQTWGAGWSGNGAVSAVLLNAEVAAGTTKTFIGHSVSVAVSSTNDVNLTLGVSASSISTAVSNSVVNKFASGTTHLMNALSVSTSVTTSLDIGVVKSLSTSSVGVGASSIGLGVVKSLSTSSVGVGASSIGLGVVKGISAASISQSISTSLASTIKGLSLSSVSLSLSSSELFTLRGLSTSSVSLSVISTSISKIVNVHSSLVGVSASTSTNFIIKKLSGASISTSVSSISTVPLRALLASSIGISTSLSNTYKVASFFASSISASVSTSTMVGGNTRTLSGNTISHSVSTSGASATLSLSANSISESVVINAVEKIVPLSSSSVCESVSAFSARTIRYLLSSSIGLSVSLSNSKSTKSLVSNSVSISITSATLPVTGLTDGLVSYWPLNEASGTRADSVGSNDLGEANTVTQDASGKYGAAVQMGTDGAVYISDASQSGLDGSTTFSASLWFNSNGNGGFNGQRIIAKSFANPGWDAYTDLTNRKLTFHTNWAGGSILNLSTANAAWSTGAVWVHVVLVSEGSNQKIYINGVKKADGNNTGGTNNGTADFAIGNSNNGAASGSFGGNHFPETIDEVGFWNRALTSAEVSELYGSGVGVFYVGGEFISPSSTVSLSSNSISESVSSSDIKFLRSLSSSSVATSVSSSYIKALRSLSSSSVATSVSSATVGGKIRAMSSAAIGVAASNISPSPVYSLKSTSVCSAISLGDIKRTVSFSLSSIGISIVSSSSMRILPLTGSGSIGKSISFGSILNTYSLIADSSSDAVSLGFATSTRAFESTDIGFGIANVSLTRITPDSGIDTGVGIIDQGAHYADGGNYHLEIDQPDQVGLNVDTFSVSLWANLENTGCYPISFTEVGNVGWSLYVESNTGISLKVGDSTVSIVTGQTSSDITGSLQHIAFTRENTGDAILYVNAEPIVTGSTTATDFVSTLGAATSFSVGARDDSAGRVVGIIDEIGYWDRILTANEVSLLYDAGTALAYPFGGIPFKYPSANAVAIGVSLNTPARIRGLSSTCVGVSASNVDINKIVQMHCASVCPSVISSSLGAIRSLSSSSVGIGITTAAQPARLKLLTADSIGVATDSATILAGITKTLTSSPIGASTTTCQTSISRGLASEAIGVAETSSIIGTEGIKLLISSCIGQSVVSSSINKLSSLRHSGAGSAISVSNLSRIISMHASTIGSCITNFSPNKIISFQSAIVGSSKSTVTPSPVRLMMATSTGVSVTTTDKVFGLIGFTSELISVAISQAAVSPLRGISSSSICRTITSATTSNTRSLNASSISLSITIISPKRVRTFNSDSISESATQAACSPRRGVGSSSVSTSISSSRYTMTARLASQLVGQAVSVNRARATFILGSSTTSMSVSENNITISALYILPPSTTRGRRVTNDIVGSPVVDRVRDYSKSDEINVGLKTDRIRRCSKTDQIHNGPVTDIESFPFDLEEM